MKSDSAPNLDTPSLWFVCAVFGRPLSLCNSLLSALLKAYELSGKTTAELDEWPSTLVQLGTDKRLDAHQIMEHWRELHLPVR